MMQLSSFPSTPQASAVDQVTTQMGNLSLEQVKDPKGDPSKRKAKVHCPFMDKFGLDVAGHIGSFLQPVEMLQFLRTSQGAIDAGERMLKNNPGAMSAILKSVNGRISKIPDLLRSKVKEAAPSIKTLDLDGVVASRFDINEIVQTFTSLQNVNFWGLANQKAYLETISSLTQLRTLDLGSRRILSQETDHFKKLKLLEVLRLEGDELNNTALRNIAACSKLRHLRFASQAITGGYEPLCTLTHLTFLDLSRSAIDDTGLLCIVKIRQLETLLLQTCTGITAQGFVKFFQHLTRQDLELSELSEQGSPHEHLREIDVSNTEIDHGSFKYMQSVKTLTWVNVSECDNVEDHERVKLNPRFRKLQDRIKETNIDGLFKYKLHLTADRSENSDLFTTEMGLNQLLRSFPLSVVNQDRHFVCKLIKEFALVDSIERAFFYAFPSIVAKMIRDFRLLVGPHQTQLNQLFFFDCSLALRKRNLVHFQPEDISETLNAIALCCIQDQRLVNKRLFDHFAKELEKRDLKYFSAQEITDIFCAVQLGFGDANLLSQFATEIARRHEDFQNLSYIKNAYKSRGLKLLL